MSADNKTTADNKPETENTEETMRIARFMSRAGICSRRDAEKLIEQKRVMVDGTVIDTPAFNVTGQENIRFDGERIAKPQATRLWRYHKPSGLVTTHADPQSRATVFDALPDTLPRVISVGRLDLNTEGLLLLTNDGALARKLELPDTGWTRRYKARVHGRIDKKLLESFKDGVTVGEMVYGPVRIDLEENTAGGTNNWLKISIKEGKNREVRHVLEHAGLTVTRLIRIAYGPFQLGKLPKGQVAEVPKKVLIEQLGYPVD